jgi:hypothetical protein
MSAGDIMGFASAMDDARDRNVAMLRSLCGQLADTLCEFNENDAYTEAHGDLVERGRSAAAGENAPVVELLREAVQLVKNGKCSCDADDAAPCPDCQSRADFCHRVRLFVGE